MKKFFSILAAVLFAGSMMAETVTLTMEDFADVSFTDQTSGISVSTAKNAGQTAPAYNATGKDLRVYAKGSITIEATKNITSISFTISDKGKNRLAPLTANVGSVVVAGDPDFTAEWTGSANSVTLTVGDIASYGTESTKAGQLCFTAIVVTLGEGEEPVEPGDEPVVEPEGPKNLGAKTIAEFLELKNTTDTCILTGVVSNIQNTTYGNFDLTDESGKVYVYGLLTPAGESKKFADLNVAENDTLTVLAIYNEHNGNPQAKNAIFVEVKKSSDPVEPAVNLGAKTIAEFLALKNTKDTCILTGVVSNIQNEEYGNFDLVDETGSVYIYGLLTPEGEAKKFAELGVEAGDTLTVLAIYSEYNGEPQVKNAIFVDLVKGEGGGSEGEFSYDYEPEEVSTFDVEMSTSEVEDYTAEFGVVAMFFESADGSYFASMELIISSEDLVEPGEYQINDSEEEGTFFASPGGDDEYDYGCYFGVTFIDPEDGKEYYYPYYLVSGNVTITEDGLQVQAKSYNGSTVKFTYVQPYDAVENTKLTDKLLKAIENGNVIIKSGNVIFDVNGQRIK